MVWLHLEKHPAASSTCQGCSRSPRWKAGTFPCLQGSHQTHYSSYNGCVTKYPKTKWHKTFIYYALGFCGSAEQGWLVCAPWSLGPQLDAGPDGAPQASLSFSKWPLHMISPACQMQGNQIAYMAAQGFQGAWERKRREGEGKRGQGREGKEKLPITF